MVVVRTSRPELESDFPAGTLELIRNGVETFGYSVEVSGDDVKIELNPDRLDLCSLDSLVESLRIFYSSGTANDKFKFHRNSIFSASPEAYGLRSVVGTLIARGKPIGSGLQRLITYQEKIHDTVGKGRSLSSIGIHDMDNIVLPFSMSSEENQITRMTTYDGMDGTLQDILEKHEVGRKYASLIPSPTHSPVIRDAEGRIMSVPPVVNGVVSRIAGSTRNFVVDVTGTDIQAVKNSMFLLARSFSCMRYSVELFPVLSNGQKCNLEKFHLRDVRISQGSIEKALGTRISTRESMNALKKMGYLPPSGRSSDPPRVPGYRIDVMGEIDAIEDIMKAVGLSNIPERAMHLSTTGESDNARDFAQLCRTVLAGAGLQETKSFAITSEKFFRGIGSNSGYEVLNPKSEESSVLRDKLYPNMLNLLRINKRRPLPQRIFEIGDVVSGGTQETHLCVMIEDSISDFSVIRKEMDYFIGRIAAGEVTVNGSPVAGLIGGRCGTITLDGKGIGVIGEVHPETLERFELQNPVSMMEITLEKLYFNGPV